MSAKCLHGLLEWEAGAEDALSYCEREGRIMSLQGWHLPVKPVSISLTEDLLS